VRTLAGSRRRGRSRRGRSSPCKLLRNKGLASTTGISDLGPTRPPACARTRAPPPEATHREQRELVPAETAAPSANPRPHASRTWKTGEDARPARCLFVTCSDGFAFRDDHRHSRTALASVCRDRAPTARLARLHPATLNHRPQQVGVLPVRRVDLHRRLRVEVDR